MISTWARRQFPWQLFLSGSARSDRGKEGEGGQEAFRGWPVALDDDVAEVDRIGQIAVAVDHACERHRAGVDDRGRQIGDAASDLEFAVREPGPEPVVAET